MSLREIRAELRKLPRDRRRDIVEAIRAGRAVTDPRDAPLAAAWAEYLDRRRFTWVWPRWVMPRERPRGRSAWLWLLHLASILGALALTCGYLWVWLPAPWRYFAAAWIAYCVVTTPLQIARMLRLYWNAPKAAAANRAIGSIHRT
ncbi:MAG: hypothetical protein QOG85_2666 [Gaiellaceae bacterium]|nr:hypothetical protein [Gaiellaceae bacterium]